MQAIAPTPAEIEPELHSAAAPIQKITRDGKRQPRLVLRSRLPGRERWHVDLLEDNPRLAAAVELVLRGEEGIETVQANPLTGKVLIHFRPELVSGPIEVLIRQALEFGPMSPEEFASLPSREPDGFRTEHFLAAELGCSALKMILFGSCCPAVLAGAGLLFLLHRRG